MGGFVKVVSLDGEKEVKIAPGTQNNQEIRISGEGVPKLPPNSFQKGDLIVKIKVNVPKMSDLNEKQIQLLQEFVKEDKNFQQGNYKLMENCFDNTVEKIKKKIF
mmetsp:Transcript_55791/g.121534  ORF Transcript_55791/g.121534 Transcript_55791/m.121534 type:complete len:105 (-) Transcript_55791:85-399(-)